MRISDVLIKDSIIPDLKARTKREALAEMAAELASRVEGVSGEKLLDVLLERERLASTGIGHGVALPHAKLKGMEGVAVLFARSASGVDFQSMDGGPVHIFFLIVAPENPVTAHLKVLAHISRLLKDNGFRTNLIAASGRDGIYRAIVDEDFRFPKSAVI